MRTSAHYAPFVHAVDAAANSPRPWCQCLMTWVEKNRNCPECRAALVPKNMTRVRPLENIIGALVVRCPNREPHSGKGTPAAAEPDERQCFPPFAKRRKWAGEPDTPTDRSPHSKGDVKSVVREHNVNELRRRARGGMPKLDELAHDAFDEDQGLNGSPKLNLLLSVANEVLIPSQRPQKSLPDTDSSPPGCTWTGKLEDRPDHLKQCAFKRVPCGFDGCSVKLLVPELERHREGCRCRTITCNPLPLLPKECTYLRTSPRATMKLSRTRMMRPFSAEP